MIKRPKKIARQDKGYMTNEQYQDFAEQQFKNIYDYLDANAERFYDNNFFKTKVLENGWVTNGVTQAFLNGDTKTLTVSIRYGTARAIGVLPKELRPSTSVLAVATKGDDIGYVAIATDGTMTVSNNIFVSGTSNVIFTVTYK